MIEAGMLSDSEILHIDNKYCSHGDTVHYSLQPKAFRNSEGSFMYDSDNVPFLDLQMWHSSCNFGYKNNQVSGALKEQIDKMPQIAANYLHENKVLLAKEICEAIQARLGYGGRVHFNVGGAQAIEDALKIVRNYKKKSLMFAFMGGYHGRTLGASAITSSYRYRRQYGHFSDRAHFVPYPYCFRCFYEKNKEDCDFYCIKQFEKLFESEYNTFYDVNVGEPEFAAFFAEAVQGTGGYIVPPAQYFSRLKKILDQYNILLVDDEVQMGLFRTGKLFAMEHFGAKPDILVFGKSLTNGMNPISCVWAREELINPEIFPPGSTHSTFAANPLGTRAGLAVMDIIKNSDLEPVIMEKGKKLLAGLEHLKQKYKNIGDVDGLGLALRIELCEDDGHTPSKALADKINEEALKGNLQYNNQKYGLALNIGGYYKNTILLAPSLYITKSEIQMAIELLDQLFKRCIS